MQRKFMGVPSTFGRHCSFTQTPTKKTQRVSHCKSRTNRMSYCKLRTFIFHFCCVPDFLTTASAVLLPVILSFSYQNGQQRQIFYDRPNCTHIPMGTLVAKGWLFLSAFYNKIDLYGAASSFFSKVCCGRGVVVYKVKVCKNILSFRTQILNAAVVI